jgi:hypothetical protein
MTGQHTKPQHTWSTVDWLREAAGLLRRAARHATPGPWRWSDRRAAPGTLERTPTMLEHSPVHRGFPSVRRPDEAGEAVLPGLEDPLDLFEKQIDTGRPRVNANARWITLLTPSVAQPLASLLDSLADSAEKVIRTGGSVDHEPYLSAVTLAKLIVNATQDQPL